MKLVTKEMLGNYREIDSIEKIFYEEMAFGDSDFDSHRWHSNDVRKRMIYQELYGDLFSPGNRLKILDVGGGFTSASRRLHRNHDYKLLDVAVNPPKNLNMNFELSDWFNFDPGDETWDIVIANDIFPNVDQRLEAFIDKFMPCCKEIRTSLTYFNNLKWYNVINQPSGEDLVMKAWSNYDLIQYLKSIDYVIDELDWGCFRENESIFDNDRQVCLVNFKGSLFKERL